MFRGGSIGASDVGLYRTPTFRRWRNAMLAVLAGLVAGGATVVISPLAVVGAAAGAVALALVARFPELGMLGIVCLVATIFNVDDVLLVPLPGIGSLNLADLLLLLLIGLSVLRLIRDPGARDRLSVIAVPLGLVVFAALVSVVVAVALRGGSRSSAVRMMRYIAYYLLIIPGTVLLTTHESVERLFLGLRLLAVFVAVAMFVQAAVGDSVAIIPGRVEAARTAGSTYAATRIIPPGLTLIFAVAVIGSSVALVRRGAQAIGWGIPALFAVVGLGLTFFRTYWATSVGAVGLMLLMVERVERGRGIVRGAILIGLAVLLVGIAASMSETVSETVTAMRDRLVSLFDVEELTSGQETLQERALESRFALRRIREVPVLGVGLGNPYRYPFDPWDGLTAYVHNAYLYATVSMGLLGSIPLVWLLMAAATRGVRNRREIPDSHRRYLVGAVSAWLVAVLLTSITNPVFMEYPSIAVLGTLIGAQEAILANAAVT